MKRPYYIFSHGRLRRKQNTIFLEKAGEERIPDDQDLHGLPSNQSIVNKVPMPIENIESLYCFGEIDLNSKLVTFLGQQSVPLFFYDYYGNFTATLYPRDFLLSGRLRVTQVKHYLNKRKRLHIAKKFIEAGSFNILRILKYYQQRIEPEGEIALADTIDWISNIRHQISEVSDIQSLMGIEGNIRNVYYSVWKYLLAPAKRVVFPFKNRERNPPSNPVNALISFGNSLCYSTTLRQIYRTALDPTISYLHEPGERRFSLALDISEIFKPLLVDRTIFSIINKGIIQPHHFESRLGGIYLNEDGRKKFIAFWDERLRQTIQHRQLNKKVSYERLIRLECYKLVRHLTDTKNDPYHGFHMWW